MTRQQCTRLRVLPTNGLRYNTQIAQHRTVMMYHIYIALHNANYHTWRHSGVLVCYTAVAPTPGFQYKHTNPVVQNQSNYRYKQSPTILSYNKENVSLHWSPSNASLTIKQPIGQLKSANWRGNLGRRHIYYPILHSITTSELIHGRLRRY
jgi:hypothetical protein